jgi:hypothetical protein
MNILDTLLGRKNKKDTVENVSKTDKSSIKTEINRQDIRDAMMGKNGKITVQGIAIDTVTMREIPMRDKLSGITATRGTVKSMQCFNRSHGNCITPMKSIKRADILELTVGDKVFELINDHFLPEVDIDDDIEIMHGPDSSKGITTNSSCGDTRFGLVLKNHTRGTLWWLNMRKLVLGF